MGEIVPYENDLKEVSGWMAYMLFKYTDYG
jgi:hypothetical protein